MPQTKRTPHSGMRSATFLDQNVGTILLATGCACARIGNGQTETVALLERNRYGVMASSSLGAPYVLSSAGVAQLAEMTAQGSAPVSTPGFSSRLVDVRESDRKLSALQSLVAARPSTTK